jgi:hypothetical protein
MLLPLIPHGFLVLQRIYTELYTPEVFAQFFTVHSSQGTLSFLPSQGLPNSNWNNDFAFAPLIVYYVFNRIMHSYNLKLFI